MPFTWTIYKVFACLLLRCEKWGHNIKAIQGESLILKVLLGKAFQLVQNRTRSWCIIGSGFNLVSVCVSDDWAWNNQSLNVFLHGSSAVTSTVPCSPQTGAVSSFFRQLIELQPCSSCLCFQSLCFETTALLLTEGNGAKGLEGSVWERKGLHLAVRVVGSGISALPTCLWQQHGILLLIPAQWAWAVAGWAFCFVKVNPEPGASCVGASEHRWQNKRPGFKLPPVWSGTVFA